MSEQAAKRRIGQTANMIAAVAGILEIVYTDHVGAM